MKTLEHQVGKTYQLFTKELICKYNKLYQAIEKDFKNFQQNLSRDLQEIFRVSSTKEESSIKFLHSVSPEIFLLSTLFFKEFSNINPRKFKIVIKGTYYGALHFLIEDKLIDQDISPDNKILILSKLYLNKFLHLYYSLFSPRSEFWKYYNLYINQYIEAHCLENKLKEKKSTFLEEDFYKISSGKASMIKLPVAAFLIMSKSLRKLNLISKSIDFYMASSQLLDDTIDWKHDLLQGNWTYVLSKMPISIKKGGLEKKIPIKSIEQRILKNDYLEKSIEKSNEYLMKAINIYECKKGTEWIEFLRRSLERNREILEYLVQQKVKLLFSLNNNG